MENILNPIDKDILKKELTEDIFIRKTNFSDNEIYIFTHDKSPNLMLEIGRLRELSFRNAGGGTGKEVDIDKFDTADIPYKQLIVWDPEKEEILGGYRFILCDNLNFDENKKPILATARLLNFSEDFIKNDLKYTIELGRSFVQPAYQSTNAGRKGLFALDNLWDGLGALAKIYPTLKYFFGKVTMYPSYHLEARDLVHFFMYKYFPDTEELIRPIKQLDFSNSTEEMAKLFEGLNYKDAHKVLSRKVRDLGENIPPLINSYMNLSGSMKCFGTSINCHFGDVLETGIQITIDDIYDEKRKRHIDTFTN